MLGAPDGPISAVAYAATMVLASTGGSKKTGRTPVLGVALGATVASNAVGAVFYFIQNDFCAKENLHVLCNRCRN